jgi:hypothetical protein
MDRGMMQAKAKPRRLSEIVIGLDTTKPVTIGTLVDEFGERAFGALIFVFAVPNSIPVPPGTSAILGLPLVILTFQLMMGRQVVWLPQSIRKRLIPANLIDSFRSRALPYLQRAEKYLRPRLSMLAQSDLAERLIGIVAFVMAVILALPIPFVNIVSGIAISVLAVGLAERDGLAVLAGYAMSIVTCIILTTVSAALVVAAQAFFQTLFGT